MPAAVNDPLVPPDVTTLHSGDRMTAEEFHRIYKQMPADFRAELVEGVVYVASPLGVEHGVGHNFLGTVLGIYCGHTPGVECGDNTTLRLGPKGEPQPDLYLRVLPECGGQSTTTPDKYVGGAPEFVAEVSYSSWSLDLQSKYRDYRRHGVLEYLVLDLHARRLHWFDLPTDTELSADPDGVIRARTFPGLWLNVEAVLARDFAAMNGTLNAGLATTEHADFVKLLAGRRGG